MFRLARLINTFQDSPFRLTYEVLQDELKMLRRLKRFVFEERKDRLRKIVHFPVRAISEQFDEIQIFIFSYDDGAAPYEFAYSTDTSSSTKMQKSYLADNTE